MPRLRTLILTIALGAGTACDDSVVGPGDILEFTRARELWDARSFSDYTYEIKTSCFCPPEMIQWARVTVQNGTVTAVEQVDPDPNFPITTLTMWQPIDSLFTRLERAMAGDSYLASIKVEYDAQLGFPTLMEFRAPSNVADGDATVNARNVIPR